MTIVSVVGRRVLRRSLFVTSVVGALALSVNGPASAADLTIPSGTTVVDPILTSTASGGPGSVTIDSGGAVTLATSHTAGTAITIDSGSATVDNNGSILAAFANQSGVVVTTATTGGIVNAGTIKTGTEPVYDTDGTTVLTAAIGGGPAVLVQADLALGIDNAGTISSVASSTNPYAVLVQAGGSSVTLGIVDGGTVAIHNKGRISVGGYSAGQPTVALGLDGGASTLTIDGIENDTVDSVIQATATGASATGVDVGNNVTVSQGLTNDGTIRATVTSETGSYVATAVHVDALGTLAAINNSANALITSTTSGTDGGDAYGVDIAGSLATITNAGTIQVTASADNTNATAIRDQAGTLKTITNTSTGIIAASASATGRGIALDLSLSTTPGGTTIANAGAISGEIVLTDGSYTINSTAGTIVSAITSDNSSADIHLSGTTIMKASSTLTNAGTLYLTVGNGATFNAALDDFNATNATFEAGSTYGIAYNPSTSVQSGIISANNVTMRDASIVDVTLESYLNTPTTLTVLQSGSAIVYDTAGGQGIDIGGIGAGYEAVFTTPTANELALTLSRKSAASLGLNANVASIYNAAGSALATDSSFGSAVGNLGTVGAVANLYNQMLPDLSSARERLAIRMQDVASGFINDRLNIMRTSEQGVGDGGGKYFNRYRRAGLWAQQAFSSEKGEGSVGTQDYDGTLYALALGYDWRDSDGDVWGGSLTYAAMSYSAGTSMSDNLAQTTMAQVYHSLNRGPIFWDMMGSVAMNSYDTERVVTAGTVSRTASGNWTGYQAGASTQVGYAAVFGRFTVRPSIGAAYTFLSQQGYDEERGGSGIDLSIDSSSFQSFRGNAEVRISQIFSSQPQYVPYLRAGVSHEFLSDQPETSGHFVSSGSGFTLTGDELDKDIPFVGAGLAVVGGYSRISIEYTGQLGSKAKSHQFVATASLMF